MVQFLTNLEYNAYLCAMRRGLLQESGAMRGLLTTVVRDMMMENDILPVTKKGTCARLGIW